MVEYMRIGLLLIAGLLLVALLWGRYMQDKEDNARMNAYEQATRKRQEK